MRKPFEVLWEAMEARRRQLEVGEVPPAYRLDHLRQEGRRDRGCPDVEALCGWVDGELRRNSLRRWLTVWRHVRLHGCRACQGEIAMIAAVAYPSGEVQPPDQRWSPWPWHALKRTLSSLFPSQVPLAWVSGALVVVVGLSLWLLSQHAMRNMDGYRVEFPSTKGESERPQPSSEHTTDGQAVRTIIWGD
ncbi:MAG: hypothetical protein ACRERE_38710 [Candidatus Entotheonellia bacterium]